MEKIKAIVSIYYTSLSTLYDYPINTYSYKKSRRIVMELLDDNQIALVKFHYPNKNVNNYFIKGKEIGEIEFNKLEKILKLKILLK